MLGVRGIGSLAIAYGGALAVRCALSVCCIAPNKVVYVVYPHMYKEKKSDSREEESNATTGKQQFILIHSFIRGKKKTKRETVIILILMLLW